MKKQLMTYQSHYVGNREYKKKVPLTVEHFIQCIPWTQIEALMGKREYNRFCKWMRGQTCLQEGVYASDLNRYLENLPVID